MWQDGSRQEWRAAVQLALTDELGAPSIPAAESAFSLADPAKVHAILSGAGFVDVQLAEACEPVYYGADGASALHAIRSLRMTSEPLRNLGGASTDRALSRLRTVFRARDEGGVWFDSCAWLVTARRGKRRGELDARRARDADQVRRPIRARPQDKEGAEMQRTINDVSIHFVEHGAGIPLVALHGAGVDSRQIKAVSAILSVIPNWTPYGHLK